MAVLKYKSTDGSIKTLGVNYTADSGNVGVSSINGKTGAVTGVYDIDNPPPYPVNSVLNRTGPISGDTVVAIVGESYAVGERVIKPFDSLIIATTEETLSPGRTAYYRVHFHDNIVNSSSFLYNWVSCRCLYSAIKEVDMQNKHFTIATTNVIENVDGGPILNTSYGVVIKNLSNETINIRTVEQYG